MTTDRMMRAALAMAASFGILLALFGAVGAKANDVWTYVRTFDAFTNEVKTVAASPTIQGVPYEWAGLRVGCENESVAAWVNTGRFNMGDFNNVGFSLDKNQFMAHVRFDQQEPEVVLLSERSGASGFSFPVGFNWTTVSQLLSASRFTIKLEVRQHGQVVLDFPMNGAAHAIGSVVDDCDAWDKITKRQGRASTNELQQRE